MDEPRGRVERIESRPQLPSGTEERFSGWGVFGLPFAAGHVLALRRFPASSVGPGFTSIWHRSPEERWTFYTDVEPNHACPRYFGSAIAETVVTPIEITWADPFAFTVATANGDVRWSMTLKPTPATWSLNTMGRMIPDALWHQDSVLSLIGGFAGRALHAGHMGLHGKVPNGQKFAANPRLIWRIPKSNAVVRNVDLGPIGPLAKQARLADFWMPQTGIFVIGLSFLEAFDADRHLAITQAVA